jgi:hypothetical protein
VNEKPHAHKLEISPYSYGGYHIEYGDQTSVIMPEITGRFRWTKVHPITNDELRAAAQALVDKHDRESIAAGERQQIIDEVKSSWYEGSEQQKENQEREKSITGPQLSRLYEALTSRPVITNTNVPPATIWANT